MGRLGLRWRGQTRTTKCRPMRAMRDPDFFEGREIHSLGGDCLRENLGEGVERSCSWIQTTKGYVAKLGLGWPSAEW